ncbi:MAG: SMC-Scp complex subunit ScpB [Clostridia bacterium]|nr:SMC-Scp complex subunit ScpB [Clostridia bacterium]
MEKLTNIIEATLFASGDAVPIDFLREKLDINKRQADEAIAKLEKKYTGDCGIRLLRFNHKVQFATNPDYKEPVSLVLTPIREKEFTRTILECAAIIAYKQPITRTELENVRGVNSDYAIQTLLSLDMIYPCGRKDTPGKPVEYATTDNFLKRFKLKSLSELPDYDELMKRIAEINATLTTQESSYLYEKDEYDPNADSDFEEDVQTVSESSENKETDGFELPDFLKDIEDGIIKIQ